MVEALCLDLEALENNSTGLLLKVHVQPRPLTHAGGPVHHTHHRTLRPVPPPLVSFRYNGFLLTKFAYTKAQELEKEYEDVHAAFHKILWTLQAQPERRLVTASPSVFEGYEDLGSSDDIEIDMRGCLDFFSYTNIFLSVISRSSWQC